MSNKIQVIQDRSGNNILPITHEKAVRDSNGVSLETKLDSLESKTYVEAWDGASTPVVANIPAGVTVTYDSTTYTGTLAASASTDGKVYLVKNGTEYDRYFSSLNLAGNYVWSNLGTTGMDLSDYATKEELSQLQQEVHNLSGKYYGIYEDAESLPEGDAVGYAFVGTQAPFAIWNFDGTDWADSGATATSIYGEPGEDGIGFQTVTSLQDGTVVITLTNGDTITIDLNHNHPQYLKYQMLQSESAMPATPESDVLYMWPEE